MPKENQNILLTNLSLIIKQGKKQVVIQVNSALTLMFWQVGNKINEHILKNKRADYGKEIVSTLSAQLTKQFGNSFKKKNLNRMMQFAEQFNNIENVVTLSRQLSWSHFLSLLPIKTKEAKKFYATKRIRSKITFHFNRN